LAALVAVFSMAGAPITLPGAPPGEPGQVFVLHDYRWVPVVVRRTPTTVECNFEVVTGSASVHAELLSERDFLLFSRHRDYEAEETTPTGRAGNLRRIVQTAGRYRLLIVNERGAPPVAVSLIIRTNVDSAPSTISGGVSPLRKLVVILASLTVFAGTVFWSGSRLLRAYRNRQQVFK
jgi:hypothetical protein